MKRINTSFLVGALLALGACSGVDQPPPADPNDPTATSGGPDTTFDHDNSGFNPFDLIDKLQKEGPPRFASRVHSCVKVRYQTLGNVLASLGVNTGNQTSLSAGDLYQNGGVALGMPNYASRIRENIAVTTSAMSREFDIFAAAADEVIAQVPTLTAARSVASVRRCSTRTTTAAPTASPASSGRRRRPRISTSATSPYNRRRTRLRVSALPSRPCWPRPTPASEETDHGEVPDLEA